MATIEEIIGTQKAALLLAAKERLKRAAATMIAETPSHTGRTRCSFQAALNAEATGTDPLHRGAAIDPTGQSALDQIFAVIDQATAEDKVFITSDYWNAQHVEGGDLKHPGHYMVEKAIEEFSHVD